MKGLKMIYIRLFHGRTNPQQKMDDWGTDGPIFGPYQYVHTTYGHHLKLGKSDNCIDELFLFEDMLYYDNAYYGDWSIFSEQALKEDGFKITTFEQPKGTLPAK
jgi:hypothetical protein